MNPKWFPAEGWPWYPGRMNVRTKHSPKVPVIALRLDSNETKDKLLIYLARHGISIQDLLWNLLQPVLREAQKEVLLRDNSQTLLVDYPTLDPVH